MSKRMRGDEVLHIICTSNSVGDPEAENSDIFEMICVKSLKE